MRRYYPHGSFMSSWSGSEGFPDGWGTDGLRHHHDLPQDHPRWRPPHGKYRETAAINCPDSPIPGCLADPANNDDDSHSDLGSASPDASPAASLSVGNPSREIIAEIDSVLADMNPSESDPNLSFNSGFVIGSPAPSLTSDESSDEDDVVDEDPVEDPVVSEADKASSCSCLPQSSAISSSSDFQTFSDSLRELVGPYHPPSHFSPYVDDQFIFLSDPTAPIVDVTGSDTDSEVSAPGSPRNFVPDTTEETVEDIPSPPKSLH